MVLERRGKVEAAFTFSTLLKIGGEVEHLALDAVEDLHCAAWAGLLFLKG